MAWIHDTGYGPAYVHNGYPLPVLLDGTETGRHPASEVIGWRSACTCGWRGVQFYPFGDSLRGVGMAPESVDGSGVETSASAEWQGHVHRQLPELAVHDLARQLADAQNKLQDAVRAARFTGLSWSRIGIAAGMTANDAQRQWGTANS
jgi:hypothetical protein